MDAVAARREARTAHDALVSALRAVELAEQNAVLRFATILHHEHFRALGFASIYEYAIDGLGFSRSKTKQFVRLAQSVERLPELKRALEANEIGWTKARAVGRVANAETERDWIEHAKKRSRRDLERDVVRAAQRARAVHEERARAERARAERTERAQTQAEEHGARPSAADAGSAASVLPESSPPEVRPSVSKLAASQPARPRQRTLIPDPADDLPPGDPPVRVSFELTGLQLAELERLLEKVQGRQSKAEALLAAFHALAREKKAARAARMARGKAKRAEAKRDDASRADSRQVETRRPNPTAEKDTRVSRPSIQLVVYRCDTCSSTTVPTNHGDRRLSAPEAEAIVRDAKVVTLDPPNPTGRRSGSKNCGPCQETDPSRCGHESCSRIPSKLRQQVLARDGHRCRRCRSTMHLDVHHRHRRTKGGEHSLANCATLCRACHVTFHLEEELLERGIAIERETLALANPP